MTCFAPLKGYYAKHVNPSGKRSIVFKLADAFSGIPLAVPCGQCIGCRLTKARLWALRCMHEKRLHRQSAFLTLTYDDAHLPAGGTLLKRDVQLFMKRLRKTRPEGLRFFACGEYGEHTRRPHYHILLFNTDFSDRRFMRSSDAGHDYFRSAEVSRLWPCGNNIVGNVTYESACYVARYCLKKVTGEKAEAHYGGRECEFTLMSRRPGIGLGWFERYKFEAYLHDSAIMNGREVRLPRYYDVKFGELDGKRLEVLKRARRFGALKHKSDNTPERRRTRERFEELKSARFAREVS